MFVPHVALASVFISEILYDLRDGSDSGREWIEVYNDGAEAVNLVSYTVLENGKKHAISAVSGGATLAPHTYAIIADNVAKFKTDVPLYAGSTRTRPSPRR